jgi:hypothetical protein
MYFFVEQSANSCLNIQKPTVPLEDLPYTLNMTATITSQHGIERVQSNCSLSPIQYLTDDKTSAQVNSKIILLSVSVSSNFIVDLVLTLPSEISFFGGGVFFGHVWIGNQFTILILHNT